MTQQRYRAVDWLKVIAKAKELGYNKGENIQDNNDKYQAAMYILARGVQLWDNEELQQV